MLDLSALDVLKSHFSVNINKRKGRRDELVEQINAVKKTISKNKKEVIRYENAANIVNLVSMETQNQISYHLSEIVSLALVSVLPEPYTLKLEFDMSRNKTEAFITLLDERDQEVDPMDAVGGGVVDLACFALKVACWAMEVPRRRPVLILDEPFKHLSSSLIPAAADMLKAVADHVGLQVIMVSHKDGLLDAADRSFVVHKRKGLSMVKEI